MTSKYFYDNFLNIITLNNKEIGLDVNQLLVLQLIFIYSNVENNNIISISFLSEKTKYNKEEIKEIISSLLMNKFISITYNKKNNNFCVNFDSLYELIKKNTDKKNKIITKSSEKYTKEFLKLKYTDRIGWN